jgi:hypothetical protein
MNTPAEHVIRKCGGHQAVAEMIGVDVTRVYRWTYSKDRGGTGGFIPARHQRALLEKAKAAGKNLKPEDFFKGELATASAEATQ